MIGVPVVTWPSLRSSSNTPGEDFHRIGLGPLGGEAALAGPALVEIALNIGHTELDPRRTAIDHAAQRRPVAFPKGRHAKQMAEGVV